MARKTPYIDIEEAGLHVYGPYVVYALKTVGDEGEGTVTGYIDIFVSDDGTAASACTYSIHRVRSSGDSEPPNRVKHFDMDPDSAIELASRLHRRRGSLVKVDADDVRDACQRVVTNGIETQP